MADIRTLLAQILGARYGRDVRQSIHDAIEQCYEDGRAGAIDLQARNDIDALDTRVGTAEGNITSLQGDIADLQSGKVTDLGLITVPSTVTTISDAVKNAIEQVLSSTASNKSYVARLFWTGNDNFNLYFTNLGYAINFELTASTAMYFGRYVFSTSSISALREVQTKISDIKSIYKVIRIGDSVTNGQTIVINDLPTVLELPSGSNVVGFALQNASGSSQFDYKFSFSIYQNTLRFIPSATQNNLNLYGIWFYQ